MYQEQFKELGGSNMFGDWMGEDRIVINQDKKLDTIDSFNKTYITLVLARKREHLMSLMELRRIDKEAELIYKMIKEDQEWHEENGITYHLSKDVKEYFKEKLNL